MDGAHNTRLVLRRRPEMTEVDIRDAFDTVEEPLPSQLEDGEFLVKNLMLTIVSAAHATALPRVPARQASLCCCVLASDLSARRTRRSATG